MTVVYYIFFFFSSVCVLASSIHLTAQHQTYATKNKVNNDLSIQRSAHTYTQRFKANRNYIILFMDHIYLCSVDVEFHDAITFHKHTLFHECITIGSKNGNSGWCNQKCRFFMFYSISTGIFLIKHVKCLTKKCQRIQKSTYASKCFGTFFHKKPIMYCDKTFRFLSFGNNVEKVRLVSVRSSNFIPDVCV